MRDFLTIRPDQVHPVVNIQEAKTQLSKLVAAVAAGEDIVIAKVGHPLAKLVPYKTPAKPRMGGLLAGKIWESEDCWEADKELASLLTDGELERSPAE